MSHTTPTSTILCASHDCRTPDRHEPGCVDEQCRGCLPRPAADGLQLCLRHTAQIGADAIAAARLYRELALVLASSGGGGPKVSGGSIEAPGVNAAAVEARSEIRAVLVGWCRLVGEERGVGVPADRVEAMGAYLARHAGWLAAHPAAPEVVDELREIAHGTPWRVAYPGGGRRYPLRVGSGQTVVCPETGCAGFLWTITGEAGAEVACDEDDAHRWPQTAWVRLGTLVAQRAAA